MKQNFYVSMVLILFSIFIFAAEGVTACLDPPAGLVSWWPGDGDASDIIGPNDGTLMNGATFAPGLVGQAFSFDGVDDEVAASGTYVNYLQQLTIEAWVYHNSLPPDEIMNYVMLDNKAELRYDGINGPQQLHFYLIIDGNFEHLRVDNVLQVGVFHHVAGTYDGSVMRLYLDGVEVGSLAVSGIVQVGAAVTLASAGEPFDGLLDEVDIYYRALSDTEIKAIFDAGNEGKCILPPQPSPPPVTYDATGEWVFLVSNVWVDDPIMCFPQTEGQSSATVTQTGNSVTIVWAGDTFTGDVIEASYTASATIPLGGGETVTPTFTIDLSSSTSGSGINFWFWTDGLNTCSGGSDLTVTKDGIQPPQEGGGGSGGGGGG